MESVKLKVQVERKELDQLISDIKNIRNTKIDIDVGNGTKDAANGIKELNSQLKEGHKQGSLFNDIWRDFKSMAIRATISEVTSAFKDALETMKAVDDEMVVIRKVSGASADELARLEEQAYKTASAYGVAADKYLNGVSAFTRAGYREQADDLAELAVKTELVGDVDAQTAQQFLISTDAAYKYNGSIQELSKVLDGANEIDNKYATSIQKIAEGMGIIAPVAAQAHVGVDELAAAIGTITAVTQRSGSESARALRALFLNIIGDTKTEIDEGVTWTTGEIAGLREVLQLYAADVVAAAEATGSVINPMEAIAALAKSYEDGILTEAKLMEMVSDIGGKLRTSQLLALIENMDMYNSMLNDYVNATGSADREVENAMDSWSRKIEIIKSKWAELIQSYLDTDTIKDILDDVIELLEFLNTDAGKATITIGLLTAAVIALSTALSKMATSSSLAAAGITAQSTAAEIAAAKTAAAAAGASAFMSTALIGTAVVGGFMLLSEVADALTTTYEEQRDVVDELIEKQNELTGAGSEYDQLKSHVLDLTEAEKQRLAYLEAEIEANKELLRQEAQAEFDMFQEAEGERDKRRVTTRNGGHSITTKMEEYGDTKAEKRIKALNSAYQDLRKEYNEGKISANEYNVAIHDLIKEHQDHYDTLKRYEDLGFDTGESDFIAAFEKISNSFDVSDVVTGADKLKDAMASLHEASIDFADDGKVTADVLDDIKDKFKDVDGIDDYISRLRDAKAETGEFQQALSDLTYAKIEATFSAEELASASFDEIDALLEEEGVVNHVEAAQWLLTDARRQMYETIFGEGLPALISEWQWENLSEQAFKDVTEAVKTLNSTNVDPSQKVAALNTIKNACNEVSAAAELAAAKLAALSGTEVTLSDEANKLAIHEAKIDAATSGTDYAENYKKLTGKEINSNRRVTTAPDEPPTIIYKIPEINYTPPSTTGGSTSSYTPSSRSSGGSLNFGSSSSESTEDKQLEALKDVVSLRKSELDLMEARGDSEEDQIEKTKEIQKALENEIAYLKKTGGEQEEINRLCTEWWNLLDDIYDLQIDALEKQRDEEVSVIEKQKDALEEARDAEKERLDYEEKILAVEEAEAALLNAQNERTVRYYNAETGQWEWGANAQNVASAQKDLEDAQKDLEDYLKDAEIEALEKQIKEIEKRYDEEILALEEQRKAETAGYDTAEYTAPVSDKIYGFGDLSGGFPFGSSEKNPLAVSTKGGRIVLTGEGVAYDFAGNRVQQTNSDNRVYINGVYVGTDSDRLSVQDLAQIAKSL